MLFYVNKLLNFTVRFFFSNIILKDFAQYVFASFQLKCCKLSHCGIIKVVLLDKYAEVLETHSGREVDASFVLFLKANVWWLLVQTDAKSLQLMFNQLFVAQRFQHIKHNQNQVASSSHWKRKAAAADTGC